ncbi:MAG: F0F1 ATP synthase subunit B [Chitinophagaceae bacterium]
MDLLIPSFGLIIWTLLSFLIVFFILKKYAWKPILSSLKERETIITDSLSTATKVKAEMVALKSENEALLVKAREERAGMIRDAKELGDKMVTEAKERAKVEYDRIIANAHAAIEQQKMAALIDVKNQVGNMVIEVSEKILRRELTNKSEQEKYISQLANDIKLN